MASGKRRDRIALVLAGGGARGAYEAGILAWVLDELPGKLGRPVRFDISTGTSVGAIHACYVAATQGEEGTGERLTQIWKSLNLESVYRVRPTDVVRIPWRLIGLGRLGELIPATRPGAPDRLAGLLDTSALEEQVLDHIPWRQIRENIEKGNIEALAVTATEIATGRSVVFVDHGQKREPSWAADPFVIARATRIGPAHALASAAMPLLFPAVRIDRAYYADGGLRLNTPLAPAIRLGADRVLVVGLRYPFTPEEEDARARRREKGYVSAVYLAGKVLNALLLDRIEYDVDRLRLFNAIIEKGLDKYGPGFLEQINEPIVEQRNAPYRIVRDLYLRPSRDLGEIADECLRHRPRSRNVRTWLSRNIARYAARGAFGEADLLSYLFFDKCYAEHLIALGRKDAARAEEALVEFFS